MHFRVRRVLVGREVGGVCGPAFSSVWRAVGTPTYYTYIALSASGQNQLVPQFACCAALQMLDEPTVQAVMASKPFSRVPVYKWVVVVGSAEQGGPHGAHGAPFHLLLACSLLPSPSHEGMPAVAVLAWHYWYCDLLRAALTEVRCTQQFQSSP